MALKKKTAASPSAKKATKKKPIGLGAKFAEEAVKKVASKKKATPAKKAAAKAPAKAAPVKKAAKAAAGSDTVDFSLYKLRRGIPGNRIPLRVPITGQ